VETLVHGTCVALGSTCALLRGPACSGKSDLALRFLFLPAEYLPVRPALVADDQVILRRAGSSLLASCPPAIAGKIEVRGSGIARVPFHSGASDLTLVVDLDSFSVQERYPEAPEWTHLLDLPIRRIVLDPFELSAPIKLALAMQNLFSGTVD
jgi:HPr kinase/phosphorylase